MGNGITSSNRVVDDIVDTLIFDGSLLRHSSHDTAEAEILALGLLIGSKVTLSTAR